MQTIQKYLHWLDNHILEILAGFLLAFLPLYPKWPLLDVLPGYIVRVRLEDFIVLFTFIIFLVQVKRGKATIRKNPLFKPITAYLIIGLLSAISAVVLTQTVPPEAKHIGKLMLHWARRVEYMSLAFVFFSAVTSTKSIKRIMSVFAVTALLVSLYGFGQKYMEWPVYSTMNREFSKGWRLVLTEHARVSSTFAGHYDLAAFTIVGLMVFASFTIIVKPYWAKVPFFLAFLSLFATLLLTASRTSFVAYLLAITTLILLLTLKVGYKNALLSWLVFMSVSFVGFRSFGSMYDRFASLLKIDRIEKYITDRTDGLWDQIGKSGYIEVPEDLDLVYEPGDSPPRSVTERPKNPEDDLPADVFEAIPENFPEASLSGIPATAGTGAEGRQRTYSPTASAVGLSSAIRFDALWPRAFAAFKKNPLFGTGYSTLVKTEKLEFTEAESTDNDYLRALGETGLLGLGSFMFILGLILWKTWKYFTQTKDPILMAFTGAFIAGLIGLMVNALYIDIFVSSKVAYTLWALSGLMFGLFTLDSSPNKIKTKKIKKSKKK